MRPLLLTIAVLVVACAPREDSSVAKRDTGVISPRVTTESPAGAPRTDGAAEVPAVPTDSNQRSATSPAKGDGVMRITPRPESLKVKP